MSECLTAGAGGVSVEIKQAAAVPFDGVFEGHVEPPGLPAPIPSQEVFMVFPKGRFAAVLLTGLLALPPSAAPAQCQQHSNRGQTGMSQMGQGRTPFMSGMMSSMSQMSMMQSSPMQWFSLQQGQQLHLQQMQMIAMQQQMQQTALQQAQRPRSTAVASAGRLQAPRGGSSLPRCCSKCRHRKAADGAGGGGATACAATAAGGRRAE